MQFQVRQVGAPDTAPDTALIGGVRTRRHHLEREASRLAHLAKVVGTRLAREVRAMEARDEALRANGVEAVAAALPEDFLEAAKWYGKTVTDLLREQRERLKLIGSSDGKPPLTEAEYRAELEAMVHEVVRLMPEDELQKLLAQRAPAPVIAVATAAQAEAVEVVDDQGATAHAMPFDFGEGQAVP